jgi:hypothetical protein
MKKIGRWCLENIGTISVIIPVGLLVLAANLDSPRGWLTIPAWGILAFRAWWWFEFNNKNKENAGIIVVTLVLASFVLVISQTFHKNLFNALLLPTYENVVTLVLSSPFLFLTAFYLAASLGIAKGKFRELESKYEKLSKTTESSLDILAKRRAEEIAQNESELKNVKEKILADLNKTSKN